jgi:DNA-directed RNA polymerase specialized sigma24 family protein
VGARLLGALRGRRSLRDEDFERLYAEHAAPLLSFLTLRTSDRALAEDLLADTFECVLRRGSTFGSERATPTARSAVERVEDRDAVERILSVLSAEEREAVTLRFGADLTIPEIAELRRCGGSGSNH